MKSSLENMNKDYKWLEKELKIKGINLNDVLLATLDNSEKVIFYLNNENIKPLQVLE